MAIPSKPFDTTPKTTPKKPRKPSPTARILENVELLLELHERQGNHDTAVDVSQLLALTEKTNEISSSLELEFGKRFEDLESKIESLAKTIDSQPTATDSVELTEFFAELIEEKNQRLTQRIETKFVAQSESIQSCYEKLSDSIVEQSLTLESLGNAADPSASAGTPDDQRVEFEQSIEKMMDQFQEKTETIEESFNSKIESLFESLSHRVTEVAQSLGHQETMGTNLPDEPDEAADSEVSHWHLQKEAMLSKYGIDPDYRPVMELPSLDSPLQFSGDKQEAEIDDPSVAMSEKDAAEIEEIKNQLNSKLREAEVELSISRAKLSRQQAEIESASVELDRRTSLLEEKYATLKESPKQRKGFLDRFTRHLGKKESEC